MCPASHPISGTVARDRIGTFVSIIHDTPFSRRVPHETTDSPSTSPALRAGSFRPGVQEAHGRSAAFLIAGS